MCDGENDGNTGTFDGGAGSAVTIPAVPLPAPALMLLGGLAGFAGLKRRKKA
jgi:hypothetical protein